MCHWHSLVNFLSQESTKLRYTSKKFVGKLQLITPRRNRGWIRSREELGHGTDLNGSWNGITINNSKLRQTKWDWSLRRLHVMAKDHFCVGGSVVRRQSQHHQQWTCIPPPWRGVWFERITVSFAVQKAEPAQFICFSTHCFKTNWRLAFHSKSYLKDLFMRFCKSVTKITATPVLLNISVNQALWNWWCSHHTYQAYAINFKDSPDIIPSIHNF